MSNGQLIFPQIEEKILSKWNKENTFQRSIDNNIKEKKYIFFDGPPFANGLPHYGHLLTGFIKDTFARYKTIQKHVVQRKFGWDCHGLPVEMEVEKEKQIHGKKGICDFGIENFNNACETSAMKYAGEWEKYVNRQGRWGDFENSYKTKDCNYMESILWAFKELGKKGLLYEDFKVMPYSWKCQSSVSNFETKMDNAYRQKSSTSVTVKIKLQDIPQILKDKFGENANFYVLIWTTTPWTLPSNLAIAINKNKKYIAQKAKNGDILISIAK